jgi:hypothetical protein
MTFGANRRADRIDRPVLAVLGGLLVVGASAGLVRSFVGDDDRPLLTADQATWLADAAVPLALASLAVLVLVALAALTWAAVGLRPVPPAPPLTVASGADGHTRIAADALAGAVGTDLGRLPGVEVVSVRLSPHAPELVEALVDLDEGVSLRRTIRTAGDEVLGRARRATGRPVRLRVEVRPVPVVAPRVR